MGLSRSVYGSWRTLAGALFPAVLTLGLSVAALPAFAADEPRRIFLLEGLTPTQPAVVQSVEAFKTRLKEKSSEEFEVYTDFLDRGRFRGPEAEERMVQFLREKFAKAPPDLIVAISGGATDFLVRHRDEFASGIPIAYCCTPTTTTTTLMDIPPEIPGVVVQYDFAGTLALAARLQPNAKTLVLVTGAAEVDRQWQQDAIRQLQPFLKNYDTRYVVTLHRAEALKTLSQLPRDSIVMVIPIFGIDIARANPTERAAELARASSAPVYSPVATLMGNGVVGGSMDSYIGQGIAVADMALDILSGKDPSTLPHLARLSLQTRVDARQLDRWGFKEGALAPGTSIEFRQPTLWEQYRRWVVVAMLALAAQGAIIALLLIQRRKRRAAEKLLKESEDRMAFAAASTNIGIWRQDVASGRLWATNHCRSMFGIPAGVPLRWQLFREAVHPDDRDSFDDCLQSPMHFGLPMSSEFRVVLRGGGTNWFMCRGHTVFDQSGKPLQVSGIFVDVTARRSAEAEADYQRKELTHMMRVAALGELSSGIAHELSQPLTAIVANAVAAQSIAKNEQSKESVGQILKEIADDGKRAGQVIHRLRRILRKEDQQSKLVNLNRLIESTLGLLRSELAARKIKVETDLKGDVPLVSGDSTQLQQVLLNLIMNAIEAMASIPASERKLGLSTRRDDLGQAQVTVSDRGPGLTAEEKERLFQPFFTTKERGLGLGLWICSTIVTSHGGTLDIANGRGGGAVATLSLRVPVAANGTVMLPARASRA